MDKFAKSSDSNESIEEKSRVAKEKIDGQREEIKLLVEEQNREFKGKYIRDPIHNLVSIEDRIILQLIDTMPMQRLRRIRQLGSVSFVYPGAEHSRFVHSLGVYHVACTILDQLDSKLGAINGYDKLVVKIAALLHDIGHGPFSHLFESLLKEARYSKDMWDHEEWTKRYIKEDETIEGALNPLSSELKEVLRNDVHGVIDKTFHHAHLVGIVTSQFDADRLDYMARDAFMTGVNYGKIDMRWLIRNLQVATMPDLPEEKQDAEQTEKDRIVINLRRGHNSLQEYLLGNLYMYENVYFHPKVQAADAMIRSIFKRALRLAQEGNKTSVGIAYDTLSQLRPDNPIAKSTYMELDDHVVNSWFQAWAKESSDPLLKKLANGLISRELFKVVDYSKLRKKSDQAFTEFNDKVREYIGSDHEFLAVLSDPNRRAYKPLDQSQVLYVENEKDSVPKPYNRIMDHEDGDTIDDAIIKRSYGCHYLAVSSEYHEHIQKVADEMGK